MLVLQNLSSINSNQHDKKSEDNTNEVLEIREESSIINDLVKSDEVFEECKEAAAFTTQKRKNPLKLGAEHPKKLQKTKTQANSTFRFEKAVSQLREIAELTNADTEDQFSRFGNHIASQLRELPMRSFIVVQEKIQSLVTQERLATIDMPTSAQSFLSRSYQPSPCSSGYQDSLLTPSIEKETSGSAPDFFEPEAEPTFIVL